MTTTARLLALLSRFLFPLLALGACAVQQAGAAGSQAAVQDGGNAPARAPAAPVVAPAAAPAAPTAPDVSRLAQAETQPQPRGAAQAPARAAATPAPAAPLSSTPVQETPAAAPGTAAPSVTAAAPATATPAADSAAGSAASPTGPTTSPPVTMPAAAPTGNLLQTLFALIVVLAVLAALAWFLKRYGPKGGIGGGANLRIVGSLNLGGRERLLVVEVGNQWIVVGASPGRVNALATMPKQEALESTAALAPHGPAANSFADWLKQTIDKRK